MGRRRLLAVLAVGGAALAGASPVAAEPVCSLGQLSGGSRPVAGGIELQDLTSTSVQLRADVRPGNAPTSYAWRYGIAPALDHQIGTSSVDGCADDYGIGQDLADLRPGTTYDAQLVATNKYGTSNGPVATFTTLGTPPPAPPSSLVLLLTAPQTTTIGYPLTVKLRALGDVAHAAPYARISWAAAPYKHWRTIDSFPLPSNGRLTGELDSRPDRNIRIRAQVGSNMSNTVSLSVQPEYEFSTERQIGELGYSAYILAQYTVAVHRIPHHYPLPTVYFYRGAGRRGPFRLVTTRKLRRLSFNGIDEYLVGAARVRDPGAHFYVACIRRSVVSDMGQPFTDRACGRRRIS